MRGFVRVGAHFVAELDEVERQILAGAFADTAALLGTPLPEAGERPRRAGASSGTSPSGTSPSGTSPSGPSPSGAASSDGEAPDLLAALDWSTLPLEVPDDPALARLLPPASLDDDELAGEFRRLTEGSLRRLKVANLRTVWSGLRREPGPLVVPRAQAPSWAAALTDVRLVLASRLGIESDEDAERIHDVAAEAGDDPEEDLEAEVRAALAALYSALTWLQESLLQAMLDDAAPAGPDRTAERPDG